ncbi:protein VASP homolog [Macrobrachium nipponense]|uniref:protein VASP homolog n=1 Tax=Macrobrachium nipponense TaxID=159736 RepID=UPI0030C7E841
MDVSYIHSPPPPPTPSPPPLPPLPPPPPPPLPPPPHSSSSSSSSTIAGSLEEDERHLQIHVPNPVGMPRNLTIGMTFNAPAYISFRSKRISCHAQEEQPVTQVVSPSLYIMALRALTDAPAQDGTNIEEVGINTRSYVTTVAANKNPAPGDATHLRRSTRLESFRRLAASQ